MPQSLICITPNDAVAQCIVEELEVSGVPRRKISVVCPVRIPAGDAMHHRDPTSRIGPSLSLTTCSALGGALGWLLGIGSLAIPGFGPTIAGGPIMQVIGDAAIGATLGGLSGALSRFGVPEYLAQRYEAGIRQGRTFISVLALRRREIRQLRDIFNIEGAEDVSLVGVPAGTALADGDSVPGEYL